MSTRKILFVDDDANIIKSLRRLFRDEGYEPYTAADGHEALKLLERHTFALILSDFRIPELNGIEFLKLAKEKAPNTIRMILTGYAEVKVASAAINEGEVYKFIEKPWDDENLKVQVRRAVEHYELLMEKEALTATIGRQNEELIKSNTELEKRVEEKTAELRKAYRELELKLKEIESRDAILQYLLSVHSFEETLDFILEVIHNLKSYSQIVIYTTDGDRPVMTPKAGRRHENGKSRKLESEISGFPAIPIHERGMSAAGTPQKEYPHTRISEYSLYIPVTKDDENLGAIFIDNSRDMHKIPESDIRILSGFAILTAIAINDHLVTSRLPDLKNKISELLGEL